MFSLFFSRSILAVVGPGGAGGGIGGPMGIQRQPSAVRVPDVVVEVVQQPAPPPERREVQRAADRLDGQLGALTGRSTALDNQVAKFKATVDRVRSDPNYRPSADEMNNMRSMHNTLNALLRGEATTAAASTDSVTHKFSICGGFWERSTSTLMETRQRLAVLHAATNDPGDRAALQEKLNKIDARLVQKGDAKALEKWAGNNPSRQEALANACRTNEHMAVMMAGSPNASRRLLTDLAANPHISGDVRSALLANPNTPAAALHNLGVTFRDNPGVLLLINAHRNAPAPTGPPRQASTGEPLQSLNNDRVAENTARTIAQQPGNLIETAMSSNVSYVKYVEGGNYLNQSGGSIARANIPIPIPALTPSLETQGLFFGMSNVNNSGVGFAVTAYHSTQRREGYLHEEHPLDDGSRRYLQSVSEQVSGGGGVATLSSLNVPTPISGGISAAKTTSVTYARVVAPQENGALMARQNPPPSMVQLGDGSRTLRPYEEISYRGSYNIGASVGVIEPHSGLSFSAGVDRAHEYATSIRRNPGEPPTYSVRVEPDTTRTNGRVAAGMGPFSVEGGGGKMHAVQYTFTMTEEAMRSFVGTNPQKLPALPDPRQALRSDGTMNTEVFNSFQEQMRTHSGENLPGVTLQSFGRTDESSLYLQASATVASIRGTTTSGQTMTASATQVSMTTSSEGTTTRSVLFRGSSDTSLRVEHGHHFQASQAAQGESTTLSRTYQGAQVTFRIADSKTKSATFGERVNTINRLMGRPDVVPPQLRTSSASDISMQAQVTPGHIQALAAMDPDAQETKDKIKVIAKALANDLPITWGRNQANREASLARELTQLIANVKSAGPAAPPAAITPRDQATLDTHHTTREQLRLENQGTLIANFMGHSEVTIAALDRLMRTPNGQPPALVTVRMATDSYASRIHDIGVRSFLDSPVSTMDRLRTNTHMREFTNTVDKIQMLRQVHTDLLADRMMTPPPATPYVAANDPNHQRAALMYQIEDNIEQLSNHMDTILADPTKRQQIMERITVAGSTVGGYWSDPHSGLGVYHDTFGHYDNPQVRTEFMDRVVNSELQAMRGRSSVSPGSEYARLAGQIAKADGRTGIPQLMRVLTQARQQGELAEAIDRIPAQDLQKLVARMTPQERTQLLTLSERSPAATEKVNKAIAAAIAASEPRRSRMDEALDALTQVAAQSGQGMGMAFGVPMI